MSESESPTSDTIAELRRRFAAERRLGTGFRPKGLRIEPDGALILEGEVASVAAKKIALELAAADPAVSGVVDRLRVRPAERMDDPAIRKHLRNVFMQDPSLGGLSIAEILASGNSEPLLSPDNATGTLTYAVSDGVVTLNGSVGDLALKRYIGVLAWWCPGARDVINGIETASDASDGPDRLADAIRAVLERDPLVDAAGIKVGVRNRIVRLTGALPSAAQGRMAEDDVWCVFGVDNTINEIETPAE